MNTQPKFPVGGSKDTVFSFLRSHGFQMSNWSDKHWTRADGLVLHVYGTGSMARIFDKENKLIADDAIETAVNSVVMNG